MKYKNTDEYFQQLEAPLKEVALKLRSIIDSMPGELEQQLKWNVPTWSKNKNICSIMAHKHHVSLQLMQGARLADVELLEGSGKDMRHLKFSQVDDINTEMIKKLLSQAIKQDG